MKNDMKVRIGKFGLDVIWNLVSLGILALSGIVINLIIILYRGSDALGVFNQIYAIYIFLSQIGVGGLQFSALKHISHNQDDLVRCANITTSALFLVGMLAFLICVVAGLLAKPISFLLESPSVDQGLKLALPGLFFFTLNKVLINVLSGLRNMQAYAIFRSLRYVFIPIGITVIILLEFDTSFLALALTISEAALFFILLIFVYSRMIPILVNSDILNWFPVHLSFGLRGALSGILIALNTRIDVLMLGYFSTDEVVGMYSFAAMIAEGFRQIPFVIRHNVDPIMGSYFANDLKCKISELARNIRRILYPIMGAIGIISIFIYPLFLNALVPNLNIVSSSVVFAIIMIGVILGSGYRPFSGVFLQGGRPGAYTVFILSLVIGDALLNLIFIPLLGIYGAALVTSLTYALEAVYLVFYTRKLFDFTL